MTGLYAEASRPNGLPSTSRDTRKAYYTHRSSSRRQKSQQQQTHHIPTDSMNVYSNPQHAPLASHNSAAYGLASHPQRAEPPRRYGRQPSPPSDRPSTPSDFPFIFGDPMEVGSVQTGSSQQELLRKKARTESKKRQKKFSKKKKEPKIVNMPPSLVSPKAVPVPPSAAMDNRSPRIGDYRKQIQSEEKLTVAGHLSSTNRAPHPNWQVGSRSSVDEKESLTVESTVTDSNSSHNKQFDAPYSSVHTPAAVVNSEAYATRWVVKEDERKEDSGSVSEFSFPLLSTVATGAKADDSVADPSVSDPPHIPQVDHEESTQSTASSKETARNVRFSAKLEQSTVFLTDDYADQPLSTLGSSHSTEKQSEFSPTSVMNPPGARDDPLNPPKSILRDSKYTRQRKNGPIDSRHPDYLRAYINNANAALYASSKPVQVNSPNRLDRGPSVRASHQSDEPHFVDHAGDELSPIRPGSMSFQDDAESASSHGGSKTSNGSLRQQPAYFNQNEEGSVASSRMAFIEAVAAVVIQTAYRRHVARQMVASIREAARRRQLASRQPRNARGGSTMKKVSNEQKIREDTFRMYVRAATIIQAAFRGFWARDCMNVDRYCATAIQRAFRGYYCRMNYQFDHYRIITVQSVWRRCLARQQVSYMLAYAIVIQSAVRRFLARRDLRNRQLDGMYSARADAAAVVIQSKWRMHTCWSRYTELLFCLIIQSVVRGWIARKKVAAMKAEQKASLVKRARRRTGRWAPQQNASRSSFSGENNPDVRHGYGSTNKPHQDYKTSNAYENANQVRLTASTAPNKNRESFRNVQNTTGLPNRGSKPFTASSALSRKLPPSNRGEGSVVIADASNLRGNPFSSDPNSIESGEDRGFEVDTANVKPLTKAGRPNSDYRQRPQSGRSMASTYGSRQSYVDRKASFEEKEIPKGANVQQNESDQLVYSHRSSQQPQEQSISARQSSLSVDSNEFQSKSSLKANTQEDHGRSSSTNDSVSQRKPSGRNIYSKETPSVLSSPKSAESKLEQRGSSNEASEPTKRPWESARKKNTPAFLSSPKSAERNLEQRGSSEEQTEPAKRPWESARKMNTVSRGTKYAEGNQQNRYGVNQESGGKGIGGESTGSRPPRQFPAGRNFGGDSQTTGSFRSKDSEVPAAQKSPDEAIPSSQASEVSSMSVQSPPAPAQKEPSHDESSNISGHSQKIKSGGSVNATELSSNASHWMKQQNTGDKPVVDKNGDAYAWAYALWAQKGLLEWTPSQ
eukprot:CAMPEP_0172446484 /NCGR_PEP_ID=MMETSP1065-20121228/6066_1 /TAXON_ID=265537 /ORGANISM="Amphiprora paludosa, Strain CCMP125" /LENGTH=1250 /DNA_ID=CAMNT_0013197613 /DNA_START=1 /DNA_END=3753 /DNA_ORIENTATION=+